MEKKAEVRFDHFRHALAGGFTLVVHRAKTGQNETYHTKNLIVDAGLKQLGDILAGLETTDIDLGFMEADEDTGVPLISDTDTIDPLDPADRLAATVQTRASVSPFEVVITTFINSTKYSRPQTISKLNVFFTPDETGTLFAAGLLDTPVTLAGSDTATLTYGIVLR